MFDSLEGGFGNWLAGFIDGEGCFSILSSKWVRRPYSRSVSYLCRLSISLRDDDKDILVQITEHTGCGTIYSRPARGTSKPMVVWTVNSQKDCLIMVAILDKYPLRAKKRYPYSIWRKAVLIWADKSRERRKNSFNGKSGSFDWSEIVQLKEQLEAANKYKELIA